MLDGRTFTDRAEAAPAFAMAIRGGAERSFSAGDGPGSHPPTPIATYRGFEVTVRPLAAGAVRLGMRCPERPEALEYATARTLDLDQVEAYGTGLFQRLDHVLDALTAELKAAQDGLGREETNLASYTEQLAKPFEHAEALHSAQRELARIEQKLTSGPRAGQPGVLSSTRDAHDQAAA